MKKSTSGFKVVEVCMILMVALGLIMIAIPHLKKAREESEIRQMEAAERKADIETGIQLPKGAAVTIMVKSGPLVDIFNQVDEKAFGRSSGKRFLSNRKLEGDRDEDYEVSMALMRANAWQTTMYKPASLREVCCALMEYGGNIGLTNQTLVVTGTSRKMGNGTKEYPSFYLSEKNGPLFSFHDVTVESNEWVFLVKRK